MTYFYDVETNRYVYNPIDNSTGASVAYISGGHLNRIEYGTRAGAEGSMIAPARVVFDYRPRCITDLNDPDSFCGPSQTSTSSNHWLDTPVDLVCTSSAAGSCDSYWPVFFDQTRLSGLSTSTFDGTNYRPIDSWAMGQTFDGEGVGVPLEFASNVALVLRSVTHTGHGGTATTSDDITQPPFVFAYDFLANRITSSTLALPLVRPRVIAIRTDSGAQVSVNYVTECGPGDVPPTTETGQAANTRLCFPVKWFPNRGGEPVVEYFHKYVMDSIVESGSAVSSGGGELITGSLATVTSFEYDGGAAWAKPTGAMVTPSEVTYSDFRGFPTVTTTVGLGDESSSARVSYFQGMGGTRTSGPSGHAITVDDLDRFQGMVFASVTLNGAVPVAEVVTVPGTPVVVAENAAHREATRIPSTTAYSFRFDNAGSLVDRTSVTTRYDASAQVTSVDDHGDLTTGTDDTCTRMTYAHTGDAALATKNLVALVSETKVVSAACDATASIPDDLISDIHSTYDSAGRVVHSERLDPVDGVGDVLFSEVLSYDTLGRPLQVADALGNVSTSTYQQSAGGLLQSVTTTSPDPDGWGPLSGFATTTTFDPITGRVTSSTDANGRVTSRTYDALGRLLAVRLPERQGQAIPSIAYEYRVDANGLNSATTKTVGADGVTQHVSVVFYDGLLRPFQTQVEGLDAGADHDATAAERGRMVAHSYYDSAGRVAKQTGQWWAEGVPSDVPLTPEAVPPSLTTLDYDAAGRAVTQIFWVGTDSVPSNEKWRTVTAYDGDTTFVVPPLGATPEATITDAKGQVVSRIQYVRDPDDDEAADTLSEVLTLPERATTYAYNPAGQLVAMHDPDGNEWTYDFDWGGRQVASTDPDSGTTTTSYDLLNQVVTRTNANDETLAYTYDPLGRVATLRDDSTTGTIRAQWAYDQSVDASGHRLLGLPSSATRFVDGAAYVSSTPTYDEAYRPLTTTFTLPNIADFSALQSRTFTTRYTYASNGQVASASLPAVVSASGTKALGAETVTIHYDTASMPSWMGGGFGWGTYVAESRFAPDGRAVAADLGNTYGAVVSYGYEDGTNRLSTIGLSRQNLGTALSFRYGYDAAGNVTSLKDQASSTPSMQDNQCFGYDGLRQLQVAWTAADGDCAVPQEGIQTSGLGGASPYWDEYEYDTLGNRTSEVSRTPSDTLSTVYEYDGAGPHQLTSSHEYQNGSVVDEYDYGYDDAGNRTSQSSQHGGGSTQTHSYSWDAQGEMTGLDTQTNIYDAAGSRIVRKEAGVATVYLPGGQEIRIEGSTVTATRYYSFAGQTVAMRTGQGLGAVTSLVADAHGSVIAAVPNTVWTSTSVKRVRWDPFGAVRATSGGEVPGEHRFLDAIQDTVSGLTLLGARYYDAVLGQFISVDPVLDVSVPAHFNAYSYAFNNPMTFSDPSGEKPKLGKSSAAGTGTTTPPPSTSWAALSACQDVWCTMNWQSGLQREILGGVGEVAYDLVYTSCPPCQLGNFLTGDVVPMFSNWDGYWAQKEADATAQWDFWHGPDPVGTAWNGFWSSVSDEWANNPGHVVGVVGGTAATFAIPGGAILKGAKAARVAGEVASAAGSAGGAGSLFRGVAFGHPAFDDALKGVAAPIGGHTDAALHNGGNTFSEFTSWTTDRSIALGVAGEGNGPGIVLRIPNQDGAAFWRVASPDVYGESEVLIRGVVNGAEVLR